MPEAPKLCSHVREQGEGTVWPVEASLDHFLHCLDTDQQHKMMSTLFAWADAGHACEMKGHRNWMEGSRLRIGQLEAGLKAQDTYIGQQVAKLRELESDLRGAKVADQAEAADRVQAILGIVTSEGEEL